MVKTCMHCGKEFEEGGKRYCSTDCFKLGGGFAAKVRMETGIRDTDTDIISRALQGHTVDRIAKDLGVKPYDIKRRAAGIKKRSHIDIVELQRRAIKKDELRGRGGIIPLVEERTNKRFDEAMLDFSFMGYSQQGIARIFNYSHYTLKSALQRYERVTGDPLRTWMSKVRSGAYLDTEEGV